VSGNAESSRKTAEATKWKYGVDEDGKSNFHKAIGARGGKAKVSNKGLGGISKDRRREIGKQGGIASGEARRKKKEQELKDKIANETW